MHLALLLMTSVWAQLVAAGALLDLGPLQVLDTLQPRKFFDTTDHRLSAGTTIETSIYPPEVLQQSTVDGLLPHLNTTQMRVDLATLAAFHNRYYQSPSGLQASLWLFDHLTALAAQANKLHGLTGNAAVRVRKVDHRWRQKSVVLTIPGSHKAAPVIILSAHLDTTNYFLPWITASPGADDNGAACAALLDVCRVLLAHGLGPGGLGLRNRIEVHFYSAEEAGLLGSQAVLGEYKRRGVNVKALFHQDMAGSSAGSSSSNQGQAAQFAVVQDYVDPSLTAFLTQVATAYTSGTVVHRRCGYACSDHASATRLHFPACMLAGAAALGKGWFGWAHTVGDTVDRVEWGQVLEHAKVAVGMVVELGRWEFTD